ncbi:MAG: hypothetical protein K9N52_01225 [Verrucomicrobia bacterium]|nr:hypothetical protein [Verrucomicrobiota bacterium]
MNVIHTFLSLKRSSVVYRWGCALLVGGVVFITGLVSSSVIAAGDDDDIVELSAGADWIELEPELEIKAGSALDFTAMGFVDPPAGKYGRVILSDDGKFAFADKPRTRQKFYGVNLCFSAQYLDESTADMLAERLARIGYNTVRLHHYERDLVTSEQAGTKLNPEQARCLDYLVDALRRRGIYWTTDIFVSRRVRYQDIGESKQGVIPMNTFKILVPVHDGARENWKQFARNFLDRTNSVSSVRYADDPALIGLVMINEGNFANFYSQIKEIPEWREAWNRWLVDRFGDKEGLKSEWGGVLNDNENPAVGSVDMPENLWSNSPRTRDFILFLSQTERRMTGEMRRFLRDEIGCRALISNANSWTYYVTDQAARAEYDYVDDHFYVDHPRFLENDWRLPSRCPNENPISSGADGGRTRTFTRLLGKPYTISEYNYSAPGRFRGVGGILTGAMGALQDWDGIWRFAYSHSRNSISEPSRMGYFDLASDPLSQAAERASLLLFLRGDMQPAPHSVAVTMTPKDLRNPKNRIPRIPPDWHWAAWITKVGTYVAEDKIDYDLTLGLPLEWETPAAAYESDAVIDKYPYSLGDEEVLGLLRERGIVSDENPTDPRSNIFESETGEILVEGDKGTMVIDTPRTAGGFASVGKTIDAGEAGVRITVGGYDATVWVSALDGAEIPESKRLLVTHLTDLQNSGIEYAEKARKTLLDWGQLPYLVRAGTAEVSIEFDPDTDITRVKVWALSLGGRRVQELPVRTNDHTLTFTADVADATGEGATILYELAVD